MNLIKYILTLIFFAYIIIGSCQEDKTPEENWKLYPNGLPVTLVDSIKQEEDFVLDTLRSDTLVAYNGPAFVQVLQDYRVKQLLEKDKFLNQQNNPPLIDGYRIKIYFGSGANSRQNANQIKAQQSTSNDFFITGPKTSSVNLSFLRASIAANKFLGSLLIPSFLNSLSDILYKS